MSAPSENSLRDVGRGLYRRWKRTLSQRRPACWPGGLQLKDGLHRRNEAGWNCEPGAEMTSRQVATTLGTFVGALCFAVSCSPSSRSPQPPTPAQVSHTARSDSGRSPTISSPCVLHAGESRKRKREVIGAVPKSEPTSFNASCSFNAECIRQHGVTSPGDGFVDLECSNKNCSCVRRLLSPSVEPTTTTFELEVPCATTETAQRLIRERCMVGLTVQQSGESDSSSNTNKPTVNP
jgi:hypothetical protein